MLEELLLQAVREPPQLHEALLPIRQGLFILQKTLEVQSNKAKAIWLLIGRGACAEILDVTEGGPCKALTSLTSLVPDFSFVLKAPT